MSLQRTGNWGGAMATIGSLAANAQKARRICLLRFALQAERNAKVHISKQDLNWVPLKPSTISEKIRSGYSDNILVRTSSYFQSITGWVSGDTALAGVKRTAKDSNGNELANIAATHEFGSLTGAIPARPLWGPTMAETLAWQVQHNSPVKIFLSLIR